jgi:hypothetical protein
MKLHLLTLALIAAPSVAGAQEPTPTPTPQIPAEVRPADPNPAPPQATAQPALVPATSSDYVRPDARTRSKRYVKSIVGPFTVARTVATSGISTWKNSPEEWGTKWEGFGRRVASSFGKKAIKQTTTFGLDEAFKLDSQFYRSKNKSVGARVKNALISPVTARDKNGKRVFGFPRLAGTYAAGIISYEAWYPDRYSWKDGVRSGTISLGFNAGFNLVKEFIWKK